MKLRIVKMIPDMGVDVDASSYVEFGCVNLLYYMNNPIIEIIGDSISILDGEFLLEYDHVKDDVSMDEDEKKYYFDKINNMRKCLTEGVDSFLNCFDTIEIDVDNIDVFDKIDMLIKGINKPVIINVRDIDDSYLIENISEIDNNLKKKFDNKITYCIKQCMYEDDAHHEDISYGVDDVLLVLNFLDNVVKDVERYNFTPFEKILYVYDKVKDRYFIYANKEESYLESRDLARVLKSEKIVCFGFAMLFKCILDKLGIENEIVHLDSMTDPHSGHVRNLVCVKDTKYELDHILYFDATWDCKKENVCDTELLDADRYDHFAKDKIFFVKKDWGQLNEMYYLPYFLRKDNDYSFLAEDTSGKLRNIRRIFGKIDWKKYCIDYNVDPNLALNISYLMSDNPMLWYSVYNDYGFCVEAYKECCKILKREVGISAFSRCLYTVRRVEHYLNPDKYNDDPDHLIDIIIRHSFENNGGILKFILENKLANDFESYEEIDLSDGRKQLLFGLRSLSSTINGSGIDGNTSVKDAVKILKK